MQLLCDTCKKGQCSSGGSCANQVHAFVEPEGPNWYACECFCVVRRRERREADRKVKEVLKAYWKRYGSEALSALYDQIGQEND